MKKKNKEYDLFLIESIEDELKEIKNIDIPTKKNIFGKAVYNLSQKEIRNILEENALQEKEIKTLKRNYQNEKEKNEKLMSKRYILENNELKIKLDDVQKENKKYQEQLEELENIKLKNNVLVNENNRLQVQLKKMETEVQSIRQEYNKLHEKEIFDKEIEEIKKGNVPKSLDLNQLVKEHNTSNREKKNAPQRTTVTLKQETVHHKPKEESPEIVDITSKSKKMFSEEREKEVQRRFEKHRLQKTLKMFRGYRVGFIYIRKEEHNSEKKYILELYDVHKTLVYSADLKKENKDEIQSKVNLFQVFIGYDFKIIIRILMHAQVHLLNHRMYDIQLLQDKLQEKNPSLIEVIGQKNEIEVLSSIQTMYDLFIRLYKMYVKDSKTLMEFEQMGTLPPFKEYVKEMFYKK